MPMQEPIKILVADDSPVYQALVRDTLTEKGYEVRVARNGGDAVELISQYRPSVLVTDWEMPDVNGIQLSKIVRQSTQSFVYVILLTGNSNKEQVVEGLQSGADDYLTKPFHSGELLARVAVGLRMAELNREIQERNKLLEELSLTDPLTGLPNRRAFEQWSTRELNSAIRYRFGFWVVMADLDRFKSVNDNHGHAAGDEVLRRFSAVLRENTRASMTPSAAPMILLYARAMRYAQGTGQLGKGVVHAAAFVTGYLVTWFVFSCFATLLQRGLEASGGISAMWMASRSAGLSAAILILAGAYQLSPWKHKCLNHCRNPAEFLSQHRRAGRLGAVRMGMEHGAFCVGCCWVLMALLFVGGIMNVLWIAVLAIVVLLEKVAAHGPWFARVTGIVLLALAKANKNRALSFSLGSNNPSLV